MSEIKAKILNIMFFYRQEVEEFTNYYCFKNQRDTILYEKRKTG